jgi:putative peptide zinc metalloprotease protein
MDNSVYKLKENVLISEFSGVSNDEYLIVYHDRQWKVSSNVYEVIQRLGLGKNRETIVDELNVGNNGSITEAGVEKIELFLKDNRLIEGTEDIPQMSKNLGQRNIWGRITLLSPNMIKKLRFLSHAYNLVFFIIMAIFGVASVVFLLVNNPPVNMGKLLFSLRLDRLILCVCLAFCIGVFHELGHSSALMRYGGEPKRIGAAVYLFMPVFFSDVTAAWQLKRRQRIMVDLGGLYFQAMIIAVLNFINIFVKSLIIKYALLISAATFFSNLVPFFKLDGYWVVCDYLGVTNMRKAVADHIKYRIKKTAKQSEVSRLGGTKKLIFGCFILFSCCYAVYYGLFFASTLKYAFVCFYGDIRHLVNNGADIFKSISIYSVLKYIVSRFTLMLFVIFLIKRIYKLIKNVANKCLKRRTISCDT